MLNIGGITTELSKRKNWPQTDLANAVNASRDNIGNKYNSMVDSMKLTTIAEKNTSHIKYNLFDYI